MPYKIFFLSILLFCFQSELNAQDDTATLSKVGFSCGFAAQSTAEVDKVALLVKNKKFSALEDLLETGNPAEKFLTVLALDYIEKTDKREMESAIRTKIDDIKSSQEKVMYCSGCTDIRLRMLHELFEDSQIVSVTNQWIANQLISQ